MSIRRGLAAFTLLFCGLLLVGCGGSIRTVPVSGKVTQAGKPFTKGGNMVFYPDKAKGNESTATATAELDKSGNYTVKTNDKDGAPAGWYKVTINSQGPSNPKDPYSLPKNYLEAQYNSLDKTPLVIEVKEGQGPEAYTINVP